MKGVVARNAEKLNVVRVQRDGRVGHVLLCERNDMVDESSLPSADVANPMA